MTQVEVRPKATLRDYLGLTKPRIIELLLVTTVPTLILAAGGWPPLGTAIATLVGGSLAAGGANVLNCFVDADIDALMPRTAHRASASGVISPRATVVFGLSLSFASIAVLHSFANATSAALAALAIIFYVGVYSLLLKRRTAQNIVWGGVAGCFPVLIGWAAVRDSLDWPVLWLFLVVFFWTPPHYWPLAIRYREQYARAEIPMLPVVADDTEVGRQVRSYTYVMIACSLAMIPWAGFGYALGVAVAGVWFLVEVERFAAKTRRGEATAAHAMRVFHGSITYLSVVFLAVAVDPWTPQLF